MKIWKFGGSSVGSAERILGIIELVRVENPAPRAIVFSAFGGVTDDLLSLLRHAEGRSEETPALLAKIKKRHTDCLAELLTLLGRTRSEGLDYSSPAQQAIDELFSQLERLVQGVTLTEEASRQMQDHVVSFGERLSNTIIHFAFRSAGLPCEYLDARNVIFTDSNFGNAKVLKDKSYAAIAEYFASHPPLQCVTGFIGQTESGKTTTLGRGGSDYTAALLAGALNASVLEIWTDVDGVLTADPRKVPSARLVPELSYIEAMELSHFGAKVLYPPTIQPVRERDIPLVVRNTFNPTCPGSTITNSRKEATTPITAISSIQGVSVLTLLGSGLIGVLGSSERLFGALARVGVNVILISQASSERSICVAVSSDQSSLAENAIHAEFALEQQAGLIDPVSVEPACSIVSVVGEGMKHLPGVAGKVFGSLGEERVNIVAIAQGSSEENISFVISSTDEKRALNALHDTFFDNKKKISLVLFGTGQVGSEVLKQLAASQKELERTLGLTVSLVGIFKRGEALLAEETPITLSSWKEDFAKRNTSWVSIDEAIQLLLSLKHPNLCILDCTASDELTPLYAAMLENGISVVGANKRIQTGLEEDYAALTALSIRTGASWRFETSVGAALPVLSTLQSLIATGDRVHRVEALLSGSLGFIFSQLQEGALFSQAVERAASLGYLEPDPRDDLGGVDFARKLLIIARMLGAKLELSSINIEPLLPERFVHYKKEEVRDSLSSLDETFSQKAAEAKAKNLRLRYVGSIEFDEQNGLYSAAVSLQAVDENSPFFNLQGSDNLVAFFTDRYGKRPLVVQGAGAGPALTASGVLWDALQTV